MKSWLILLAGLLLWAAHFFLLYGIGEFAGDGRGARIAVGLATIAALGLAATIGWRIGRMDAAAGFVSWRRGVALFGLILGAVAILWQSLPAMIA